MTAELLSPEWVALWASLGAGLPGRPGATGIVRWVASDARQDDESFDVRFVDGRVVSAELGGTGDADVVLSASRAVLGAIVRGDLESQTALMQGKLRSSATGPLLVLLPVLQSPAWRALERELAAATA